MLRIFVSEVNAMEILKKHGSEQEGNEPWPEFTEFEPMPSCMEEYHSWRWKI